jgi:hypothetical protein
MVTRHGGHVVNITTTLVDNASSSSPSALTALTKGGLAAAAQSLAVGTPPGASGSQIAGH